jgi:ABC-2 type transport system permease protein
VIPAGGPYDPYAGSPGRDPRAPRQQPPGPHPPDGAGAAPGSTKPVFRSLCSLMARTQVTKVRVRTVILLSGLAILSGVAYGNGVRIGVIKQPLVSGAIWIDELGLGFVVPVATLLFASSMFGDPIEDKTLVYLWLRPVSRARITVAAALTSFLVTWPLVVPAMAATAACTGGGRKLVVATIISCTVAVAGYTGVFVALGARVKMPLVWGLLYVIMWEKYVAEASTVAKALSLRSYATSILSDLSGVRSTADQLGHAFLPLLPAMVLPLGISALGLVYATRRLSRTDVA